MELGIKNKVALLTGASTGLGFACAESLAREGAKIAFCSRTPEKVTQATQRLIEIAGTDNVLGRPMDYNNSEQMTQLLEETQEKLGPVDMLVCSSGGPTPGRVTEFEAADYLQAIENNLTSMIRIGLSVLPNMQANKWGRIVFITSSAAVQPITNLALSNVARSGLHAFAKTLANEVAIDGITVNCVMPGKINTDRIMEITRKSAEEQGRSLNEQMAIEFAKIPAGRYGQPQELANLVTFLCSDKASYLTGGALAVDGGIIAGLR